MAMIEEHNLTPYLTRVRRVNGESHTLVVLSEVRPDMRAKRPECMNSFGDEVKRLVGPDYIIMEAEMMLWGRNERAVFLDDSAEKIREFLFGPQQ